MLKQGYRRLKVAWSSARLFLRHSFKRGSNIDRSKKVFFDISDPRLERYLYWLIKVFDAAGWGVLMRFRPWLLLNLRNCGDFIYDATDLRFVVKRPAGIVVALTNKRRSRNEIFVDTDYFGERATERSLALPFSMHPDIYHSGLDRGLKELHYETRRVRVFIGGNLSDSYDTHAMELFGLMNRSEVTRAATVAFRDAIGHLEISSVEDVEELLAGKKQATTAAMRSALAPLPQWMSLLAASEFFIAPPGVIMPFSHNIIEAMAVGTIPITQYGEFFDPPLVDGETCLKFSDELSLRQRILDAVSMSADELARLRTNVSEYYDQHLAPEAVVKKIVDRRDTLERVYLIAGHVSLAQISTQRH